MYTKKNIFLLEHRLSFKLKVSFAHCSSVLKIEFPKSPDCYFTPNDRTTECGNYQKR